MIQLYICIYVCVCAYIYIHIYINLYTYVYIPGNGYLLQYSCLEYSMDRGTWQATVHGVAEGWTQLSNTHTHTHTHTHTEEYCFSCQVMLNSFAIPWTTAQQASLSMRISWTSILEWVAISFSKGSSQKRD